MLQFIMSSILTILKILLLEQPSSSKLLQSQEVHTISQNVFSSIAHGSNYGGDFRVAASMYVVSHMEDEHAVLAPNAMKADN
jgi:hypothetical protein